MKTKPANGNKFNVKCQNDHCIYLYFEYHRGEAAEDNNKNINFNIHDFFVCGLPGSALLDGNESHRHNKTFSAGF